MSTRLAALALAAGMAGCAASTPADDELFEARLSGGQEVPAVATAASGEAQLRYDHRAQLLRWQVSHAGLSGPVTGAHIHGPAGPEQAAPPVIAFTGSLNAVTISGQARITPEQYIQLRSGQWYVNLHTARHPQGEVRGQLRPSRY